MSGHVYFIQVGTDGPIKIGFTKNNIKARVRAMQTVSPHILHWIGCFVGSRDDERNAHRLLQNSSLRGEWFYPTVEVLAFVRDRSPDFTRQTTDNPLFFPHRVKGRSSWKPASLWGMKQPSEQEAAQ